LAHPFPCSCEPFPWLPFFIPFFDDSLDSWLDFLESVDDDEDMDDDDLEELLDLDMLDEELEDFDDDEDEELLLDELLLLLLSDLNSSVVVDSVKRAVDS
jgi:hypothetical protein